MNDKKVDTLGVQDAFEVQKAALAKAQAESKVTQAGEAEAVTPANS